MHAWVSLSRPPLPQTAYVPAPVSDFAGAKPEPTDAALGSARALRRSDHLLVDTATPCASRRCHRHSAACCSGKYIPPSVRKSTRPAWPELWPSPVPKRPLALRVLIARREPPHILLVPKEPTLGAIDLPPHDLELPELSSFSDGATRRLRTRWFPCPRARTYNMPFTTSTAGNRPSLRRTNINLLMSTSAPIPYLAILSVLW